MRPFSRRQNGRIQVLGDFSFHDQKPHQRMHGCPRSFPSSSTPELGFAAHELTEFFGPERRPVHGLSAPCGHEKATHKPQIPSTGEWGEVTDLLEVYGETLQPGCTGGERWRVGR